MKIRSIVAAVVTLFVCLAGQAETLKVFVAKISDVGNGGLSDNDKATLRDTWNAVDKDVDFGAFVGPRAVSRLNYEDPNYSYVMDAAVSWSQGYHTLVYRTERYDLVSSYSIVTKNASAVSAWVVEDKTSHQQYAVILPSGNDYNDGKEFAYHTVIGDKISACQNDFPNAKIYVLVARSSLGTTADSLRAYLVGTGSLVNTTKQRLGLFEIRNDETVGGVYTFADISLRSAIQLVEMENANISEPMIVTTLSYLDTHTVTFVDDDDTKLKIEKVAEGGDATPPVVADREAEVFDRWDGNYLNVQQDETVKAVYVPRTFDVVFEGLNGNTIEVQRVEWGCDAMPPAPPEEQGYRFVEWEGIYTNVRADLTIRAKYIESSATTYFVTFKDHDGTELSKQEVVEGESAVPPEDPVREGHTFSGWSGTYENVHQDEEVVATYKINQFEVVFLGWDDSVLQVSTNDWHTSATPPEAPARLGYTFASWAGNYENIEQDEVVNAVYAPNYEVYDVGTVEELFAELAKGHPIVTTIRLTEDLDFSGVTISEIARFDSVLDGDGHKMTGLTGKTIFFNELTGVIRNLVIEDAEESGTLTAAAGLFARTARGARFSNVTLRRVHKACNVTNFGGALFAFTSTAGETGDFTIVSNCTIESSTIRCLNAGSQKLGGFVGVADHTKFLDCRFVGAEEGVTNLSGGAICAGAIVGKTGSDVVLERCEASGRLSISGTCGYENYQGAGGLVGSVTGVCSLFDCTNHVGVSANLDCGVGGLVGRVIKAKVYVSGAVNYGELSSNLSEPATLSTVGRGVGGIVGGIWYGDAVLVVSDTANFGTISAGVQSVPAGGIVGAAYGKNANMIVAVTNVMNAAAVTSSNVAGGIFGNLSYAYSKLCNVGNSGAISSPEGSAGGILGCYGYYINGVTTDILGAMQSGSVTTGNGYAGNIVGRRAGEGNNACKFSVSGAVLAGSVVATNGGQTALVCAGTDPVGTGAEIAYSLTSSHALDSTLVHYYNKNNEPESFDVAPETMAAGDLTRKYGATKWLNDFGQPKGFMRWVRGRNYPELAAFGEEYVSGLMLIVR